MGALIDEERKLAESLKTIEAKLLRVRAIKNSLMALDDEEPVEFEGKLADAIRTVLMAASKSFVPIEVRDGVKALGFVFREDQNQMAAVHGVLKRLVDSGHVKTKGWRKQPGVTRYYWAAFDPALNPALKANSGSTPDPAAALPKDKK